MLSMPKGCGAEICSAAMRFRMTLGAGFLRNRFFHFFVFFLKIRDRQKYSLLLGGTIFNFLNFLTSILKGEAVQRRQILI